MSRTAAALPEWPISLGAPRHTGCFRESPEAFRVEEVLPFEPEGAGEHLWLECEKRNLSTAQLVRHLGERLEVAPRAIGVSGRKDHRALTRQWVSVALPGRPTPPDPAALLECAGVRVLRHARHPRKLKRGVHCANRFALWVTGEAACQGSLQARFEVLADTGVPNYFGPQRFGHQGSNLTRARALMADGWRKKRDPEGMLLSSARSFLFNEVLAARIENGGWCRGLDGDVFGLDGSASRFAGETLDETLRARLARLDIHPTGPMWGRGPLGTTLEAAALERRVIEREPALTRGIEAAGADMARRPLRVRLAAPWVECAAGGAWLYFELPRGSFATAVLRELFRHPAL